jgi:hypothetical protein
MRTFSRPLNEERVEHPYRGRQEALHTGAVGLVERIEDHPEGDAPLVAGHLGEPVLTHGVPLLLRECHRSERDDVLLLVVEVSLGYRIELVERVNRHSCITLMASSLLANVRDGVEQENAPRLQGRLCLAAPTRGARHKTENHLRGVSTGLRGLPDVPVATVRRHPRLSSIGS